MMMQCQHSSAHKLQLSNLVTFTAHARQHAFPAVIFASWDCQDPEEEAITCQPGYSQTTQTGTGSQDVSAAAHPGTSCRLRPCCH